MSDLTFGAEAKFTPYLSVFSGREGRRIRVGRSVTASFHQISDAIRVSRPYDCIEIESGKYFESLLVNHPLELCSAKDGEPPVIVSRGPCLKITTDGPVRLHSLVILAKGTKESDSQGIVIERGNPIIEQCETSSIYVMNDSSPQISHCNIRNSDYGYGLYISGRSGGVYTNNDISYHSDLCVHINTEGKPGIFHNRISQKKGDANTAVLISGRLLKSCEPLFCENIVRGGGDGIDDGGTKDEEELLERHYEMDFLAVHSPEMLRQCKQSNLASLVSVKYGAVPVLKGNLLCGGVTGFYFGRCCLPPDNFCDNRIMNCTAWGIVIAEKVSLVVQKNDIQFCGGGISVFSSSSSAAPGKSSHCVTLNKCHVMKNFHYGVLINRSAVHFSECNISENSVAVALLDNCEGSVITNNTLSGNTVAAFSILHRGVAIIENNNISGVVKSMYGVVIQNGSTVTLKSNNIEGVATSILVRDKSRLEAMNNKLRKSSAHHIVLAGESKATVQKNIMEGSAYASIVVTEQSECTACENVMLSGSREGFLVELKGKVTIERSSMSSLREAVYVKTGASVHFEDNDVTLSQNCVIVEGDESECTVINNRFRSIREVGIYALDNAVVTICKNFMTNFSSVGIQIAFGAKAKVEDNNFTDCCERVIHVDGAGTECSVVNCRLDDVGYGVSFTRNSTGIIKGNKISNSKSSAVVCNTNGSLSVHNNKISESSKGIEIYFVDDIYNNVIDDCNVGIMAASSSIARVRENNITNCTVGVSLMSQTCVSFSTITIKKSKEIGFLVTGSCGDVTVSNVTIEDCGVAGVVVQKDGNCRFEQCVLKRNKEEGVWLQSAGAVVFEQCSFLDHILGVKVTHNCGATQTADVPLFVNCTIDGDLCEQGVLSADGGIVRLNFCTIKARCPKKGCGVVVNDGGEVWLTQCDVFNCPRVGVTAFPNSALMLEHSSIENCGTGVIFAAGNASETRFEHNDQSHESCCDNLNGSGVNAAKAPKLTQLTIRGCPEAGILFEPFSRGVVDCVSVLDCGTGVVLQCKSFVVLTSSVLRGLTGSGLLLLGPLSHGSVLAHLSISDSEDYGIMVDKAVSNHTIVDGSNSGGREYDGVPLLTIEDVEVLRGGKGGAIIEASVCLEGCKFDSNAAVGVICQGALCQPLFSHCHMTQNVEANVEVRDGSMPELRDCVFENAAIGVRARSALKMTRCVARHLGVAVDLLAMALDSVEFLKILECGFFNNKTSIFCSGDIDKNDLGKVFVEKCIFKENLPIAVCVNKGSPQILLKNCDFEMTSECVKAGEASVIILEECSFKRNIKAITVADVESIEVKSCTFTTQAHYAVGVIGKSGTVKICDNSFSESRRHGVSLFAEEAEIVLVHNNNFRGDVCGVFIQNTPQAYVYNNNFSGCDTGILLHGEGFCGNIFGNKITQGVCGCRVEENSTAHLWRNEFIGNNDYGFFSTNGAKPVVVNNTFANHKAANSVAISVSDNGGGHFAFNHFIQNVCGVHVKAIGCDVVIVNNSIFDANEIAIRLEKDAAVHILACTFVSSISGDISATGLIEKGRCVLAYNCFASNHCPAVTVGANSTIVVYRSIFFGAGGKGVVQCRYGTSLVYECFFYELECGICAEESGSGSVDSCMFVRCMAAVRVRSLAITAFSSCFFLASSADMSALVMVHHAAKPKFYKCTFIGASSMKSPLLESCGGGSVEDSFFIAGSLAVMLDRDCIMTFRRNTFFCGDIGVRFNALSKAKVEENVFYQHRIAAVSLMDNAGGELSENTFAQPPENGGIMMNAHNVTLGACKTLEGHRSAEAEKMSKKNLETDIVAAFVSYLSQGPYCIRQGMCRTQHVAVLPQSILEALNDPHEIVSYSGKENERDPGIETEKDLAKDTKEKKNFFSKGLNSTGLQRGGANTIKNKSGKKKKKHIDVFTFPISDTIFSLPQDIQNSLSSWINKQGVTLNLSEIQQHTVVFQESLPKTEVEDVLHDVGQLLTTIQPKAEATQKRGNFADCKNDVVRGAAPRVILSSFGDSTNSSVNQVSTRSEKDLKTLKPTQKAESAKSSTSIALLSLSHLSKSGVSSKTHHEKENVVRRRRKMMQPPLLSTDRSTLTACRFERKPLATLRGTIRACVGEYRRDPIKKPNQEKLPVPAEKRKRLGSCRYKEHMLTKPLNKNQKGAKLEKLDALSSCEEKAVQNDNDESSRIVLSISGKSKTLDLIGDYRLNSEEKEVQNDNDESSRIVLSIPGKSKTLDLIGDCRLSSEEKVSTSCEDSNTAGDCFMRDKAPLSGKSFQHVLEGMTGTVDLNNIGKSSGEKTVTEVYGEERDLQEMNEKVKKETDGIDFCGSVVGKQARFMNDNRPVMLSVDSQSKDDNGLLADMCDRQKKIFLDNVGEKNNETPDDYYDCSDHGDVKKKTKAHSKKRLKMLQGQDQMPTVKDVLEERFTLLSTSTSCSNGIDRENPHHLGGSVSATEVPTAMSIRHFESSTLSDESKVTFFVSDHDSLLFGAEGEAASKEQQSSTRGIHSAPTSKENATFLEGETEAKESTDLYGQSCAMRSPPKRCETATPSSAFNNGVINILKPPESFREKFLLPISTTENQTLVSLNSVSSNSNVTEGVQKTKNMSFVGRSVLQNDELRSGAVNSTGEKSKELTEDAKISRKEKKKGPHYWRGKNISYFFPKMSASSLSDTHGSGRTSKGSNSITEKPDVPALSKKGVLLLDAIGETALQGDDFIQAEVRAAVAAQKTKKYLTPEKITPCEPLHDVVFTKSTDVIKAKEMNVKEKEEGLSTVLWNEEETEEGTEESTEEEIEDIIRLLKWLADMREKKLLSDQRFSLAVECIQKKANIPFFLCEGGAPGTAPTLMVHLPQTADETVVVPLLGALSDVAGLALAEEEESEAVNNVQLRTTTLGSVKDVCVERAVAQKRDLMWVSRKWKGKENKGSGVGEANNSCKTPVASSAYLSLNIGKQSLPYVRSKLPQRNFQGGEVCSVALNGALNTSRSQQTPSPSLNTFNEVRDNSELVNLTNRGRLRNAEISKQRFLHATIKSTYRQNVPRFNPAIPKETSPFNESPRVAALIAAGTANLLI